MCFRVRKLCTTFEWIWIYYKRSHQGGGSSSFGRKNLTGEMNPRASTEHARMAGLRQPESDVPLEGDSSRENFSSAESLQSLQKVLNWLLRRCWLTSVPDANILRSTSLSWVYFLWSKTFHCLLPAQEWSNIATQLILILKDRSSQHLCGTKDNLHILLKPRVLDLHMLFWLSIMWLSVYFKTSAENCRFSVICFG